MNFSCQGCHRIYSWDDETPMGRDVEVKTIGNRFCAFCEELEAEAFDITVEKVRERRIDAGRPIRGEDPVANGEASWLLFALSKELMTWRPLGLYSTQADAEKVLAELVRSDGKGSSPVRIEVEINVRPHAPLAGSGRSWEWDFRDGATRGTRFVEWELHIQPIAMMPDSRLLVPTVIETTREIGALRELRNVHTPATSTPDAIRREILSTVPGVCDAAVVTVSEGDIECLVVGGDDAEVLEAINRSCALGVNATLRRPHTRTVKSDFDRRPHELDQQQILRALQEWRGETSDMTRSGFRPRFTPQAIRWLWINGHIDLSEYRQLRIDLAEYRR